VRPCNDGFVRGALPPSAQPDSLAPVRLKLTVLFGATVLLATVAAGCGGSNKASSPTTTSSGPSCAKDQLHLVGKGRLTVGTDNPAYPPWFGGTPKNTFWKVSDPRSGQGFESAVAYAVAKKLGFTKSEVHWLVVPFEQSFRPGSKTFDFDINQISYTKERAHQVDFSRSYYNVNQALIGTKGTPITKVKTQADVKKYKLGVQLGTTSYEYVVNNIKPDQKPSVYNNSQDVTSALKAHQIDGIVVDLPTAFFITGSGEVPNSVVVGQFPTVGTPEHFGMVFEKGNSLVSCVNKAIASLKSDGTLEKLQREWLSNKADAPVLK
jgi:polar amino acid transport system substrate-binding protein